MKSTKYIAIIFIVLTTGFASCEKIIFEKEPGSSPQENFDYLWNELNNKYAFFDLKEITPEDLYNKYIVQISEQTQDTSLFNIMACMLNELRDGHVNLVSPFNVSRYDITLLGQENINSRLIKTNYLKTNSYTTGPFKHNFIKNNKIGYIRYSSFASSSITNYELDFLLDRYRNTEGLIIDIRQNGGGAINNVFMLLSRFITDTRLLYETQIKSGPEKDAFTTLEKVYSENTNYKKYEKPVAILTDRGSYSASSFFATCTYALDHVFLVGDTTGGGLGLPNGGQLPNGWTYRFSITRTIAIDKNNYENGVPPDYTVLLSQDSVNSGIDNVIEFAAREILSIN